MKFEFVSYIPGGLYKAGPSAKEVHTRMINTEHYALVAEPGDDQGSLVALWAACSVRFGAVFEAESMVGDYEFPDVLDIGLGRRFPATYNSKLPYLKWWQDQRDVFVDLEMQLKDVRVSVYMNVPHGNELISSLQWFVASANCQPSGLSYEIADLDKSHKEDDDPSLKGEVKRASPSDVRAIKAANALSSGKISFEGLSQAFNLKGGPTLVQSEAVVGADGFLESHRALLSAFRRELAPLVGRIPTLEKRFLAVNDTDLGIDLAEMFNATMRSSYPDIFAAQRAQEEIWAAEARRERESKSKR